MTASSLPLPFEAALRALAPGAHVCSISESELEHFELTAAFVQIGLERGEKCVCVANEGNARHVEQALAARGVDVAAALARKSLVLLSSPQASLKGDSFDPYRMFTFWRDLCSRAREEGFPRLRGACDMDWILRSAPGAERWLAYERHLTELALETRCLLLCQYHRPHFRAAQLLDVIRTHPTVSHGGAVAQNIYHQPSEVPWQADPHARELESLLGDISNRARVDDGLRRQQEEDQRRVRRLNVALGSSTVAFSILDAVRNEAGRIIDFAWRYVNPAAARIIGRDAAELIGKRIREVLPDAWSSPGLFESYVHAAETGEQGVIEAALSRNGLSTWWRNIVAKLDDGVAAVWFPEAGEGKRAEADARRSEAHMAEVQELSHTGSWAWDVAAQEISFWSIEHFRIFGLAPDVRPSDGLIRSLIHPDDVAFIEQDFARAVRERAPLDHEFRILRGDEIRHLRRVGHPVFDDRGALIEYAGSIVDCTEQKRAEAALRSAQSELVRASRLATLGELTASITHEVKQPLAAILAEGEAARLWLDRPSPNVPEASKAIEGVIENARRAREVIARIRSLASKADSERELLDLNELIRETLALADGELRKNRVMLQTDFSVSLPRILGDRVQLQQVALNLTMNAIEAISAAAEGPREIAIRTVLADPQALHVTVRDSGIGVPEEDLEKIFEPFYTTKPQGTGVGLSISRSIIEAHSGRLWAQRNQGAPGIAVHFVLPVAPARSAS